MLCESNTESCIYHTVFTSDKSAVLGAPKVCLVASLIEQQWPILVISADNIAICTCATSDHDASFKMLN